MLNFTPSTPTMTVAAMSMQASPLTQRGMMVGTFQYPANLSFPTSFWAVEQQTLAITLRKLSLLLRAPSLAPRRAAGALKADCAC